MHSWNNRIWLAAAIAFTPLALRREALEHPAPWIAFLVGVVLFETQPPLNARAMMSDPTDRGSALFILIAVVAASLACTTSLVLRPAATLPASVAATLAGLAVTTMGLALRIWAIRTLGRWFTPLVALSRDQVIVRHGPYARLRHPSYTGTLIAMLGLCLAYQSWYGIAAIGVLLMPAYLYRITIEERRLASLSAVAPEGHQARTWRLLPFVY